MEQDRFSYAGTNADMNEALLDRFGSFIEVPYMSKSVEQTAIASKVPDLDGDTVEGLVRVADAVRQSREVSGGFSTRMLLDWGRRIAAGRIDARGRALPEEDDDSHVLAAAYGAFLRRQKSTVERDAIAEVIRRVFVVAN